MGTVKSDSKDTSNGHTPANDRCVTPVLPDFMDPSLCYLPNSYQHPGYYFSGKSTLLLFLRLVFLAV